LAHHSRTKRESCAEVGALHNPLKKASISHLIAETQHSVLALVKNELLVEAVGLDLQPMPAKGRLQTALAVCPHHRLGTVH
jgi:hypothetical protein